MTRAWSASPLLLLLLLMVAASATADLDVASRLINVSAVEGQTAELPCDVTPPLAGDELRLVLWYHGTGGTPIYTYDARGRKTLRGEHWVDNSLDRTRVQFQPDAKPAHLRVTGVQRADQRLYRCRVDFLHSPTRNSRVNLTVIVPPKPPVLYDGSGRLIRNRAGPFREGQTVTITCVTGGGSPSPNVTWWSGNALLDGSWQGSADGAVRNQLTLGPLSRADLGAEYTCWATNHVLSPPRSTTFSIDLILRPLTVNLLGANKALSAGTTYQLTCDTSGSRPAATVTWWLGGQKLKHAREEGMTDTNMTRSVLSFTPDLEALGQQIRCQAENHKLRGGTPLQQTWPLTIHYKPRPTLRLWSALQDRGIRQGDDVFMKCDVRADPPVTHIQWRFQSRPIGLYPHLSADITNGSLVLREVTTRATGQYSCEATNAEGTVESNHEVLDVQVLPVCAADRTLTVLAARGETVNVTCRVSANPEPFRYTWALNASGAVSDVVEARVTSAGLTSVVSFTPRSQLDFGTLLCWADNHLGRQRQPCRIKLVLAERPGPLHNCSVLNRTTSSLETACEAGFHGGLQQWFAIMVRDTVTQEMVANRSSALPRFHVGDLQEGRNYSVTLYAYNDRGRGPLHRMTVDTLTAPAEAGEMIGSLSSLFRMTPILGILIGIVGTLVLLAIAIVVTMRLRGHNDAKEGYPASGAPEKAAPGSAACHIPTNPDLLTVKIDDIDDPEERYMAERLINRPPPDLTRKFSSRSPPPNSTYCSLGRGEYTRVPSPKMPVYQGPYFSLPRESGQRSCSSDASECRYDPAHSHSGNSDSSTLEEAAPLMSDRRESVV